MTLQVIFGIRSWKVQVFFFFHASRHPRPVFNDRYMPDVVCSELGAPSVIDEQVDIAGPVLHDSLMPCPAFPDRLETY